MGGGNGGLNDAIMDALEFGEQIGSDGDEIDAYKPEYVMVIQDIPSSVGESLNDIVVDYKKSRNMLYSLMETCQKALEGAFSMSLDVVHPRSYEVLNALIQSLRDISKDLVQLQTQYQKALQEIKGNDEDNEDLKNEDETDIMGSLEDVLNGISELENKANSLQK